MLRVTTASAAMFTLITSVGLVAGNPAHAYTFITIDNPGDPNFNQLLGINNKSVIAGYFGDGSDVPNNGYTVAPPYTSFSAENLPGAAQTQVVGINNTGTTVGFWVDGNGNNFGFYYQGTTFISVVNPLGPSFNQLLGVNDSNVAAGFYNDSGGASHGYITTLGSGTFTAIAPPSSFDAASVTASDINNAGIVSGFFTDAAGNVHGFLDNGGTFTQLDDPNGNGTNTSAFGLNNVGDVVGSFVDASGETQGFVYDWLTNAWTTVSDPFASANPAFGVGGTTINGVNDLGQLVGFYSDGTNVNGFLATPVPEPSTWAMLALGFVGLGFAGYRKAQRKGAALA
jgi:hypothetical protein